MNCWKVLKRLSLTVLIVIGCLIAGIAVCAVIDGFAFGLQALTGLPPIWGKTIIPLLATAYLVYLSLSSDSEQ